MKILHLISSGGMYGAENVVAALAVGLERAGHFVTVGVFENAHKPDRGVADQFEERDVRVVRIPCKGRLDWKTIARIRNLITSGTFELLHTHGYKSDIYGFLAAKGLSVPLVATCHLWTRGSSALRMYEFIDSLILRRAQRVVGVSDRITDNLVKSGTPRTKASTVYNGADFSHPKDRNETLKKELGISDRLLIGSVGRLEPQKGFEYFIRAAKEVLFDLPNATFVIIGEGSQRARLSELIHELGLESHVLLLGQRNDMPQIYASLDLFVLASIDEGMPMTVLEALCAGRPVVATRVGAVDKLIFPEETGLLVEPRDVTMLSRAILRCLRDPIVASQWGLNGEQHVRRSFSVNSMVREYQKVYLLAANHNSRRDTASREA